MLFAQIAQSFGLFGTAWPWHCHVLCKIWNEWATNIDIKDEDISRVRSLRWVSEDVLYCNSHLGEVAAVWSSTVYPKKYAHGFVVLCFAVVMQSFIMNSHEVFIHIHQGCFAGTGAIVRLPQCQWSKPDGYGKISQCITTTKHSKAKTVCIFIGIYCIYFRPNCSENIQQHSIRLMTRSIYLNTISYAWPTTEIKWPLNTCTPVANGSSNNSADLEITCGRHKVNPVGHSIPSKRVLKYQTLLYVPGPALIDPHHQHR